jgi:hypothetical protein
MNFRNVEVKVKAMRLVQKENYSLVFLKDSRLDKKTEKWVSSPYANVHFAANAHKKIGELVDALDNTDKFEDGNSMGVFIILKGVSLTNESYKDKETGESVYPKQITVWDWDFPEEVAESNEVPVVEDEEKETTDEDSIPF